MCGIAGIIDKSKSDIDPKVVHDMCNNMYERGPDAGDVKVLKNAVLGHRRLSILDLSNAGNQPMSDKNGRYWIVFNGEIYNHKDLRKILIKDGYQFYTRTDTESLLYGYQKWGFDLPNYCRGMWSFAIWDTKKEILFVSRDRMGEKPFYYSINNSFFSFASSLSGIRPSLSKNEISFSAVASLIAYEYIPHDECIYKNVKKLAPGHNLIFNKDGLNIKKYWDLDYKKKLDVNINESINLVEDTIKSSVNEQIVADVPVGVFLSGGVDSGLVTALAVKNKPKIKTISLTVPDNKSRDESKNAAKIAKQHKTDHVEVPINENCIKMLPKILSKIEPLGDSSLIPVSYVSEAAKKHLKVVLTGDGGDEGFGGYGKALLGARSEKQKMSSIYTLWKLLSPIFRYFSKQRITPLMRLLRIHASGSRLLSTSGYKKYLESWEGTPDKVRKLIYGTSMRHLIKRDVGKFIIEMYEECNFNYEWEGLLGVQIKTRLSNDFLFKVDSGTMFHSIESRAPLLDYRLFEIVSKLPWDVLFSDGQDKSLLKIIAAKHNPRDVVYGQKKGFSVPVETYFNKGWGKLLNELINNGVASDYGLINPAGVKNYLSKHGLRKNYRLDRQLYSILVLEIWLRTFHERSDDPDELGEKLFYYSQMN